MRAARRPRSAPTISDVARRAGVSPMTVSRVINGEGNVRAQTRVAVNDAIVALAYQPNTAARALAGAAKCRVGLLYAHPSAAYLGEILVGALDQASRQDVQLVVEECELGDHEIEVARSLIDRGIDGVMLMPPLSDSRALIGLFAAEGVPAVLIGSGRPSGAPLAVGIDEHAAAVAMTRHILALGHCRVGFIVGNPAQIASARRLDGYRAALADAGIAFDEGLVAQGAFTYRSGLEAAQALLARADRPSAIFASNDDMAAAAVAVAHRLALDVPADLTVCGFDDSTLATAVWPALTTIRQPVADMSRAAVELLVATLRARAPAAEAGFPVPVHRQLDFALVRRESDAPPGRRRA